MNAPKRMWTSLELVKVSAEFLAEKGIESARLDAELLLAHVLGTNRMQLYVDHERPMLQDELDRYRELLRNRGRRMPLQLLVGDVQLYESVFQVRAGVFIPRPETEVLIHRCIELPFAADAPAQIIEVGVGSGCIGVSLLQAWPEVELLGYDLNPDAIELTQNNAEAYFVESRLELRQGDAFEDSWPGCDLLVSNPPYVLQAELADLAPEVRDHDPVEALISGEDGLNAIRSLVERAPSVLRPGGWIVFEHGSEQGEACRTLLADAGLTEIATHRDLAGHERVSEGRRAG